MADLSNVAQTVGNTGDTVATLPDNFLKHFINTSDAGRELVVSVVKSTGGNVTDAVLETLRANITQAGGVAGELPADTGDAFTIAAVGTADGVDFVSGTTTAVFLRVQGTGTFDLVDAAAGTGATVTVVATFQPRS